MTWCQGIPVYIWGLNYGKTAFLPDLGISFLVWFSLRWIRGKFYFLHWKPAFSQDFLLKQDRKKYKKKKKNKVKNPLVLESFMGCENYFLLSLNSKTWQNLHSCSLVSPWCWELNTSEGKERSMSNIVNIHVLDVSLGVSRSKFMPDVVVQPRRRRLSKNLVENLLFSYWLKEVIPPPADDSIKWFFFSKFTKNTFGFSVCVQAHRWEWEQAESPNNFFFSFFKWLWGALDIYDAFFFFWY